MSIDVESIRRRHTSTRQKWCRWCSMPWPCDALQATDEIEALRVRIEALSPASPAHGQGVTEC